MQRVREEKESERAVYSLTTIATPPSNGFGTRILAENGTDVKRGWHSVIDECLMLEDLLDLRISRLMLIREQVLASRAEAERIIFAVENGGLP